MRGMAEAEALKVFRESDALPEGHFLLRRGLHSRQVFPCALADLAKIPAVKPGG